jgi:hypothetical protein
MASPVTLDNIPAAMDSSGWQARSFQDLYSMVLAQSNAKTRRETQQHSISMAIVFWFSTVATDTGTSLIIMEGEITDLHEDH